MSGQDMRKIMENLNTETPKKEKLNESLGGTPIANDIMELAAKLEAIQNTPVEELAEADVDVGEEAMTGFTDPKKVEYAHQLGRAIHNVIMQDTTMMGSLYKEFHAVLDNFAPGWDND